MGAEGHGGSIEEVEEIDGFGRCNALIVELLELVDILETPMLLPGPVMFAIMGVKFPKQTLWYGLAHARGG